MATKGDKPRKDIERFTGYFKKQLEEISQLTTTSAELYRRLLYVSVLDTLAGSVLPKRRNKDRFTYFIQRFCQWPDGDRVSLPHLVQLLRKNPDPVFEHLREWATEKHKIMPMGGGALVPIGKDPTFDEAKREWPVSADHRTPIEGVDLASLRHYQLHYTYRNMLVHELRLPGYGMEFENDLEPFYHGMSTVGTSANITDTVELVYPWRFLHRLCEKGLEQLQKYFTVNGLNPYDSFVFGTYWIRELNK
jgi:hypothetical protein